MASNRSNSSTMERKGREKHQDFQMQRKKQRSQRLTC